MVLMAGVLVPEVTRRELTEARSHQGVILAVAALPSGVHSGDHSTVQGVRLEARWVAHLEAPLGDHSEAPLGDHSEARSLLPRPAPQPPHRISP